MSSNSKVLRTCVYLCMVLCRVQKTCFEKEMLFFLSGRSSLTLSLPFSLFLCSFLQYILYSVYYVYYVYLYDVIRIGKGGVKKVSVFLKFFLKHSCPLQCYLNFSEDTCIHTIHLHKRQSRGEKSLFFVFSTHLLLIFHTFLMSD